MSVYTHLRDTRTHGPLRRVIVSIGVSVVNISMLLSFAIFEG
jgi:hypothetical protein